MIPNKEPMKNILAMYFRIVKTVLNYMSTIEMKLDKNVLYNNVNNAFKKISIKYEIPQRKKENKQTSTKVLKNLFVSNIVI